MIGFCYAMESPDRFKFGWSEDPRARVYGVKTSAREPITLIGYVHGSRTQEALMHELLRAHRIEGEWYVKNPVTRKVAALFPACSKATRAQNDIFVSLRGNREQARSLIKQCLAGGASLVSEFPRLSSESGLNARRLRAIWNNQARLVTPAEIAQLEAAAQRARDFASGAEA